MNIKNIGLRILLDIPAIKILTNAEDLRRFEESIREDDLEGARIVLEEAVNEDTLISAYCYIDSDKVCMTSMGIPVEHTCMESYTY